MNLNNLDLINKTFYPGWLMVSQLRSGQEIQDGDALYRRACRWVLDNMQSILNCRAGTLAHLPDYGLPDMTKILQGMPGTAHQLITTLSAVLLKYEPRLSKITVVMLEQTQPGELRYAIDAELKGIGLVRYGTEFMPEGKILIRHMKQQQYLDARAGAGYR
ncbi:type VI secretion system baseplate subunit TssE [Atlantibacter hermannii]|uniref:type VI secretion system baseplate subunit TssE n=1 Tax=Atlantibacter hermannii TaxID=565 RepID=UPI002DB66F8A|nr:type VI secretion system baseplate subunit TssE [Atlantibacter hermannii]MEB7922652.1 type VI secretion system baseplate subunit TssE [Atlantibacter hermannii]